MDTDITLLGADCNVDSIGPAFVDEFYPLPYANEGDYLVALLDLCRKTGCHALVPGSCPEIEIISQSLAQGWAEFPCPVICQPHKAITTHGDKLHSYKFLAGKVPLARFADGADHAKIQKLVDEAGFPLVVKPRVSSGAKAVHIVLDLNALKQAIRQVPLPVVQEFIPGDTDEYSVGLYADEQGCHSVAFRRTLGPEGVSWMAESVHDEEVARYCQAIVVASKLSGSVNVQVRKGNGGVFLLEINPRFSSLVAARAMCGFQDLEWSLLKAWGMPYTGPTAIRPLRFRRFFHELVDIGDGYHAATQWLPRTFKAGRT